jgi:hypothetical protein
MFNRFLVNWMGCGFILFIISLIAAWGTHVFTCLSDERWGFLIAGAIAFPVAIVHGVGIWFGFF